jgi:hypothetical protein
MGQGASGRVVRGMEGEGMGLRAAWLVALNVVHTVRPILEELTSRGHKTSSTVRGGTQAATSGYAEPPTPVMSFFTTYKLLQFLLSAFDSMGLTKVSNTLSLSSLTDFFNSQLPFLWGEVILRFELKTQALYHLSHSPCPQPFLLYFSGRFSFCLGLV